MFARVNVTHLRIGFFLFCGYLHLSKRSLEEEEEWRRQHEVRQKEHEVRLSEVEERQQRSREERQRSREERDRQFQEMIAIMADGSDRIQVLHERLAVQDERITSLGVIVSKNSEDVRDLQSQSNNDKKDLITEVKKELAKASRKERKKAEDAELKQLGLEPKPTCPRNAFGMFIKEKIRDFQFEEGVKWNERMKRMGGVWNIMEHDEKKIYREKYEEAKEQYKREIKAWEEKKVSLKKTNVYQASNPEETAVVPQVQPAAKLTKPKKKRPTYNTKSSLKMLPKDQKRAKKKKNDDKTSKARVFVRMYENATSKLFEDTATELTNRDGCGEDELWVQFDTDQSERKVKKSQIVRNLPPRKRGKLSTTDEFGVGYKFYKWIWPSNYHAGYWRAVKIVEILAYNGMFVFSISFCVDINSA